MNNKKNKMGFTLIELLAVIVILAIIALIATPLILGVIDNSKLNALKNSAYSIIKAGEIYIAKNQSLGGELKKTLLDNSDVLEYKGIIPKGYLIINETGQAEIYAVDGKNCAYKTFEDKNVSTKIIKETDTDNCKKIYKGEPIDLVTAEEATCDNPYILTKDDVTMDSNGKITDYNNTVAEAIEIPKVIDGIEVKVIGMAAFQEKPYFTCVTLNEGLLILESHAFAQSFLKKIDLPDTIRTIGTSAFWASDLEAVKLPKNLEIIEEEAFSGTNLITLTLPEGLVSIGTRAFYGTPIKKLTIPVSVNLIGSMAFFGNHYTNSFIEELTIEWEPGVNTCGRFDDKWTEELFGRITKEEKVCNSV